jgi:sugar lactone lactonase YvrE
MHGQLTETATAFRAIALLACANAATARAQDFRESLLVPPSAMHAVEGIVLDERGRLYGTSIHAQRVYRIDTSSGRVEVLVDSPDGESDDVAVGPAGTPAAGVIAWTAQRSGEIRARSPGGKTRVLLRNAPRVNPIAFNRQGRLFAAQSGAGNEMLWELDSLGQRAPRQIMNGMRLNGFAFGPNGLLYAPHFGTDRLLAIDVDRGEHRVVASGLGAPAAVRVAANGDLYSVDYLTGDLWHTDPSTGVSRKLTKLPEPLDSLAIANDGGIYLSSAADSSILRFDPASGAVRTVVRGWFTLPSGMAATTLSGQPSLLIADTFGYRFVNPKTGVVTRPPWLANRGASTSIAATNSRIAWAYASAGRVRVVDRVSDALLFESAAVKAPRGIALLPDGNVLVLDAHSGEMLKIGAAGTQVVARGLQHPVALLVESAANALVSEYSSGRIVAVELATGTQRTLVEKLDKPTGVARLADGRIAVIEASRQRVVAIDTSTGARAVLARGLPLSLAGLDLPADTPAGIVAADDGSLYLSCPGDNSIRVLRPPLAAHREVKK